MMARALLLPHMWDAACLITCEQVGQRLSLDSAGRLRAAAQRQALFC